MLIVCAPDSFKESMSAARAAEAMAAGVRAVLPDATAIEVPLSDGGEGFATAMASGLGVPLRFTRVPHQLDTDADLRAAWVLAGELAVIEVAQAVGLDQVPAAGRRPRQASTAGVGVLISAALDAGARRIVVGLGGSATTDAGAGMLAALGVRFSDADGRELAAVPESLVAVTHVDLSGLDPRLAEVELVAACDVDNPLTGPAGAAAIFGPQKGASPTDVVFLDDVLARIARATEHGLSSAAVDATASLGRSDTTARPGAGAAGGLGWALMTVLGATMRPGFDVVAEVVGLDAAIAGADLVLSGEGSLDAQTLAGKAPAGVARLARAHGVPVVLFGGRVTDDASALLDAGVRDLVCITPPGTGLDIALWAGPTNLERATARYLTSHAR